MLKFVDGPAAGKTLCLRRAPLLLRVVIDQTGHVDALDQLDDQPEPGESIHVYQLARPLSYALFCSRGRGCRREFYGHYKLYRDQPPDDTLRDTQQWHAWANSQTDDLIQPKEDPQNARQKNQETARRNCPATAIAAPSTGRDRRGGKPRP